MKIAVLTNRFPAVSETFIENQILSLLDLGFLVMLGTMIAQRVFSIWLKRKRNQAGSRLHVRMVSMFTLLAVAPASRAFFTTSIAFG